MADVPVIMVGFVAVALESLAEFQPDRSVIVIDEPDVVRKRGIRGKVAHAPIVRELIEWEYQLPGAADEFFASHRDLGPAAVAPFQEYATVFAARLAERYGLPGGGLGAMELLRDKALLRRVTAAAGVLNPRSVPVDGPDQVREFMATHSDPVVLKPANRQAAVGTKIVRAGDDVDAAWAECLAQDEGVMVPDRQMPIRMLVEQFVEGHEYSVEMLLDNGDPVFGNITDKLLYPGARPIEWGHIVPADIDEELRESLMANTRKVLDAVGFGTGVIHCEWIVSDGTPYLVECAGRFAGDGVIALIEQAYPVPMVRAFWTLMKGQTLSNPLPDKANQSAAVRFLRVEPGEVLAVDGMDDAAQAPGVLHCDVDVAPGDRVNELRSSWDRVGSVIALGRTGDEAMRRADEAISRIHIKVAPVEE
ncbi:MAG: ATP-grasp domain-containing protein [Sciscionella sp.]|nr:ATP-grasp domain-containing protein [Sciscionella sp.]